MIKLMQWPSTKQLLLLWLLVLGIFSSYARHGFHSKPTAENAEKSKVAFVSNFEEVFRATAADSCTADFNANSLNNRYRLVLFTNLSVTTIGVPNGEVVYFWDFGDGILSNDKDPKHSYVNNGSYNVCLVQTVQDSVSLTQYCVDTICKQVVVNYQAPPCSASFVVDTANSHFGNIILWNNSTPNSKDTLNQTYYGWSFGDGDSSTLAFPKHIYEAPGVYEVCLTITSYDSINNLCSETHCDSIGADSTGKLIYKGGGSGFTLNVMNPHAIGRPEQEVVKVNIYPNPAHDFVFIQLPDNEKEISWELLDATGKVLKKSERNATNKALQKVDTQNLKDGLYFIGVKENGRFPVSCYKLRINR